MPLSITLPAITRPRRRAEILTRRRLLDLLYDLLERKLILVVAPAGYGKTSLLIDFAHQKEISTCWYSVDQHDHDLRRFLAHFIASIGQVYPAFGQLSSTVLQRLDKRGEESELLITTIVNELYECVHEHFVIVLDDFHVIGNSPDILNFISRLINRANENCHLVIAARQQPNLPGLELMIARGQAGGIDFRELAFTPAEIHALARKQQQEISLSQASELAEQTEGWITGILLTPSPLGTAGSAFLPGIHAAGGSLAAYWDLLVNQQPQAVRDFLLYSSALDEFNASICTAVYPPALTAANSGWDGLLETVLHSNLFVLPVGEEGTWLRYHSLFQDYLQERLEREHPGAINEILRQVIRVYAARGNWERAYHTSRRLGDLATTLEIIEQAGPTLLRYERINTLTEWLESIPRSVLAKQPGLVSLQGVIALQGGNIRRGLELLNQAESALRNAGNRERLARTLARRSTGHYYLSHYQAGLHDANEALEIVGDDDNLLSIKGMALRARGVCLHSLDRTIEGLQDIEQALSSFQILKDGANSATTYQELGIIYRSTGDFESAQAAYLKAEAFWRAEENPYRLADLLNNLGVFYHHLGDYDQAAAAFNEGLKYARLTGFARIEAFILASLGDLYADLLAIEDAEKVFRQAWDIAQRIENRFLCFYVPFALACLALGQGDLKRAYYLHGQAIHYAETRSHLEPGLLAMQAGRLALAENRLGDATQQYDQAVEHFQAGKLSVEQVKAHCYYASALFAAGDITASLAHLKQAFLLAPPAKVYIVLLDAGRNLVPVLEYARHDLELGSKAAEVLERLRKFEAVLPEARRKLRKNITKSLVAKPRISIRALGGMYISVNDQAFNSNAWQSRVQRELFFYLLRSKHGATKESLFGLFWPNAEKHGNQLIDVVYKIRQLLGNEIILYQEGRYLFNRALNYEYDVEEFTALAADAEKETDPTRRAYLYRQMLQLYRGDYLPEAEGTWATVERETLRQYFIAAILDLSEHHLNDGDYSDSLSLCLKGLEHDPCREEAYRLAMRIAAAMGNRAHIDQHYELCKRALAEYCQVTPSAETHQLYRQLMQ
ncbi:MAG TPA: BTAD domain-containing putative transcriptional regulator [Anaerolineales bacterium]|nr:BTAD domain-containing putative transcriptional regulator [Anaerolineales bacterium]